MASNFLLMAVAVLSAASAEDTDRPARDRAARLDVVDRAPNPERLEEYEAYKKSATENGMTRGMQRTLDAFAAKVVFPLNLDAEDLSPTSDGIELRKAVDRAEHIQRSRATTHNIVPDGVGGFRYEPKPEVVREQSNARLLESVFKMADRGWISKEDEDRLNAAVRLGEEGRRLLLEAQMQIKMRRGMENELLRIQGINDPYSHEATPAR